jgi:Caspase domain
MSQLTGAALAAAQVSEWLERAKAQLPVPLRSQRVLLSPSPQELAVRPDLGSHPAATMDAFREAVIAWQEECGSDRENLAIFYFAGHGVREANSVAVLLEEFAQDAGNPLSYGASVSDLFAAMAPTPERPDIARHQLWFIDSCQTVAPGSVGLGQYQPGQILPLGLPGRDDRCAPIFYAALPGSAAYAIPGSGTVFGKALVECLEGAAGTQRGNSGWKVTPGSLSEALQMLMAEAAGGTQSSWTGGQISAADRPIVRLEGPPSVRIRLKLTPPGRAEQVKLSVTGTGQTPLHVPVPLSPNPFHCTWPAGLYEITAAAPHDRSMPPNPFWAIPPVAPWEAEV